MKTGETQDPETHDQAVGAITLAVERIKEAREIEEVETQRRDDAIWELYWAGWHIASIARLAGMSPARVSQIVSRSPGPGVREIA